MSAVTHSGPWTSNGKPRYIPCRCSVPTVAAVTRCQSPCSPFSPKEYIERFGKKSTKITKEAIQELAKNFAKEIVKRLPKYALTKTVIYPIVKQVAKWIGVKLTKDSFAKGLGKVVPILGGVISGGLTYVTFRPGAKKLKNTLHNCCVFMTENACKEKEGEYSSYEEVNT